MAKSKISRLKDEITRLESNLAGYRAAGPNPIMDAFFNGDYEGKITLLIINKKMDLILSLLEEQLGVKVNG